MSLEREALRFIARHALLRPGSRIICAASAGADSMALLDFLHQHRAPLGIALEVAHLHHGIAEALSDEAEACVRRAAAAYGLPLHVRRAHVPELARRTGLGVEAAGRRVRQRWFERLARARDGIVVTAHTADDLAETVLLRMLRGSGTRGLSAILPSLGDPARPWMVRPFLDVRRVETRAWAAARGLDVVEDPTNEDAGYSPRNRIRLELLPALARDYNPSVVDALCRLASIAREDADLIDALADEAWDRHARSAGARVLLDASTAALSPALRSRLYRRAARALSHEGLSAEAVARLDGLLQGPPGRRTPLGPGLWAERTFRALELGPDAAVPAVEERFLHVPGEVHVHGWRVRATIARAPGETSPRLGSMAEGYRSALNLPWQAVLDAGAGALRVRCRRPGERWRPAKGSGSRKLKATLNAWHVPVAERDAVPIVAVGSQLACLPGWGIDERFRPRSDAQEVLQLEIAFIGDETCSTTSRRFS